MALSAKITCTGTRMKALAATALYSRATIGLVALCLAPLESSWLGNHEKKNETYKINGCVPQHSLCIVTETSVFFSPLKREPKSIVAQNNSVNDFTSWSRILGSVNASDLKAIVQEER